MVLNCVDSIVCGFFPIVNFTVLAAADLIYTCVTTDTEEPWTQMANRTGKPGVLQSMGLQRVGHDLATEQQQEF